MYQDSKQATYALAKLTWHDRKGADRMVQGNAALLAKRLQKLRCPATLRLLSGEVIGGCEPANGGQDDKRIKWAWWYDKSALEE